MDELAWGHVAVPVFAGAGAGVAEVLPPPLEAVALELAVEAAAEELSESFLAAAL